MAKPQRVRCFKANLEDKPGALLAIMQDLKTKNIALIGLWGYTTQPGKAELFVVPKNPEKLKAAWSASGTLVEERTAFLLKGVDKTGALIKPLEALAQAGVNLSAADGIAVSGNYGSLVWVSPTDVERAAQALGAK
jgi:hypothetical protein